ncbi:MAG: hypothetical protein JNM90_22125 [Burkholderiales bacterium]|nr:hypothetical protein [Burkholderiales bacterium]
MLKTWFGAASFELGSLVILLSSTTGTAALAAYALAHAIGSALIALALLPLVPARYARPRRWVLLFLFSFSFFVPIAGLVCVLGGLVFSLVLPRFSPADAFGRVEVPRFTTHRNAEGTGFRGGQVRAQLANDRAPVAARLTALSAVQHTPARLTGGILRELLADPVDDVRLLAYGMLDGKEKAISARILAARDVLAGGVTPAEARAAHRQIAELYWELIYQSLVQGDMLTFAAGEASRHARLALESDPDDAGLWFILGRLGLASDALAEAGRAFDEAGARGFPRERLLPYLGEWLFRQRRYSDVRALFGELRGKAAAPALLPLRRFWGPV